jgi:hypothetical protein
VIETFYGGADAEKEEDAALDVVQSYVAGAADAAKGLNRLMAIYVVARASVLKHGLEPDGLALADARAESIARRMAVVSQDRN